jgi:hypothetical protein
MLREVRALGDILGTRAVGAWKIEVHISGRSQKDSEATPSSHQVLVVTAAGFGTAFVRVSDYTG